MKLISLGGTELKSSRLAYGCWRLVGAGKAVELTPDRQEDATRAIMAAYDAGYRYFDHADIYSGGLGEEMFGRALKAHKSMRNEIVLATKCGVRMPGPKPDAPYRYDFSAEHILKSCEESLKRLRTDRIDLFLLHRPDYLAEPGELARAFTKLKQAGKVREFGLSNASPAFFDLIQKPLPMRLIVNQVEISLMRLDFFQNGTMEHCMSNGITPLAWGPLSAGRLSFTGPIDLNEPGHAKRIQLRDAVDRIARRRKVSRAAVAIAWLLKHPGGIVPIIGSTDPRNIRELAKAVEVDLTREEWYSLMEGAMGHRLP